MFMKTVGKKNSRQYARSQNNKGTKGQLYMSSVGYMLKQLKCSSCCINTNKLIL